MLREMPAINTLGDAQYVSLETYRKDGTGVPTPVWVARVNDELGIFTNGDSYKVKRLRRNERVRIAECGVRGALKGPWHLGAGRLVEDGQTQKEILDALHRKYGWQMRLLTWGAKLRGTDKNWAFIAVALADR